MRSPKEQRKQQRVVGRSEASMGSDIQIQILVLQLCTCFPLDQLPNLSCLHFFLSSRDSLGYNYDMLIVLTLKRQTLKKPGELLSW